MQTLIRRILTSKVYEAAIETPLEEAIGLSHRLNNRILLKREDLQPIFSFKLRGAYNKIAYLSDTQIGEGREALFAVSIPEAAGSLRHFCNQMRDDINITEFNYRLADRNEAQLFMGVSVGSKKERDAFSRRLPADGYQNMDLTDNELAKTHLRYMIGGRSPQATRERLFRFWFPERPGALSCFLVDMSISWNISLFHYRTLGSDFGRVLIGLEIPDGDEDKLSLFLDRLGYRFVEETEDPAYRLFL